MKNIKKALRQSVLRSFFIQSAFSLNKMQALGWLIAYLPIINITYDEKETSQAAKPHLEFFNTHPWFVTSILGVCAHESENLKKETDQEKIKTLTMGPLGGVGDALVWYVVFPIVTAFSISIAQPQLSAIVLFFGINIPRIALRYVLMFLAYRRGVPFLSQFAIFLHKVHFVMKPIGLVTLGALIVIGLQLVFKLGGTISAFTMLGWFGVLVFLMPRLKLGYMYWVMIIVAVEGMISVI
jgi:PTS system N-acetylgalactosamine-specific IID component